MSEKSYVSMGQHICKVCGIHYDTGEVLLDRRLKNSMERYTVTGYGFCPEHEKLRADGYIALVECFNDKTKGDRLNPEQAYRTGRVAHIKKDAAKHIFNIDLGDEPIAFVQAGVDGEKGVLDVLEEMMEHAKE